MSDAEYKSFVGGEESVLILGSIRAEEVGSAQGTSLAKASAALKSEVEVRFRC